MRKKIYFDTFEGSFWPHPSQLQRYFLAPQGQAWAFDTGNDSAWLGVETGSQDLNDPSGLRVDLYINGHRDHGVFLAYAKWDGRSRRKEEYSSKGNLNRLRERVLSLHGTAFSAGLFVPFHAAWDAVSEFMNTSGNLPKSIEWIADDELPSDTFVHP